MLIDTHAHLNFPELMADIEGVLARAKEAGVEKIINIGTSLDDSKIAIELAQKHENLYATVGIHPESPSPSATDWIEFEKLALMPSVVAIGECGLDNKVGLPNQKEVFEKQVEIAKKLDLPLVIHVRDAWEEIAKMDLSKNRGVFHCYSGPANFLPNFYYSFAGNLTFKNAHQLRETAKLVPSDKLVVETDCPFLAPEPVRGSRNEPGNVRITATVLAELKNMSTEDFFAKTTENAKKLFKI